MRTLRYVSLVLVAIVGLTLWKFGLQPGHQPDAGLAFADDSRITLQGTGATFPAPLYQKWFRDYNQLHPNVEINYQALGSGAGIKQFQQGLVDFGASDAAMTDQEMAAVKQGVVLLPMTAGSIVLAYNLPGVTELQAFPRCLSRHLPRQDNSVERPGDRESKSRSHAARYQDHGGDQVRRQRHDLRVHFASERHQRGLEERTGGWQGGQLSRSAWRVRATPE